MWMHGELGYIMLSALFELSVRFGTQLKSVLNCIHYGPERVKQFINNKAAASVVGRGGRSLDRSAGRTLAWLPSRGRERAGRRPGALYMLRLHMPRARLHTCWVLHVLRLGATGAVGGR